METPGVPSSRKPHVISRDKNKSERRKRDLSSRRWGECPLEPELLEGIAKAVPNSLTQAREEKPLNLWQMFKKMCSHDTRRALGAMLSVLESFGKSLGSVTSPELHPAESDLTGIESPAKL